MPSSNLAIDVGNTRTKLGVFSGHSLLLQEQVSSEEAAAKILSLSTNHSAENIILSSVAGTFSASEVNRLRQGCRWLVLDERTPLPIQNRYRTPATLGKDRLAAVVGAWAAFSQQTCLVIDAGTCITYDLLLDNGDYLGGNIAPGLHMRLRAMHTFTARLPEVDVLDILSGDYWLGGSTTEAMQNGAQAGALLEVEGWISYCEREFGVLNVIFTGGDADFFAKHLKRKIFVNQNLVLEGLNEILIYNA